MSPSAAGRREPVGHLVEAVGGDGCVGTDGVAVGSRRRSQPRTVVASSPTCSATRRCPSPPAAASRATPTPDEAEVGEAMAVRAAVLALDAPLHETLVLRHVVGLSVAEAAEAAGVSPEALRVRSHRAAQEVRRQLGR